ncbi:MAG: hypothetical protein GQE15_07150 [Archangiaceae bacterium]|nr:hypothetical protein [Archangiaceae bacterium]
MPSTRCLLLAALLLGDAARAQATFSDGFEGSLLGSRVQPGVWDFIGLQYPNQQVVTEGSAVKRGVLGLRTIDNHRDAGVDTQVVLGRNITGTGNQYTRVWWRVSASNGVPGALSFLMTQGNTAVGTLAETKWNPATNEVRLVCFDRNSMFFSPSAPTTVVPDGGFHLVELALQNVGTVAATCSYAIDGSERARQQYDHTGTQFSNILVGPVYGESEWTGVMDYDDFAASPAPIASRVDVTPTQVTAGVCETMTLRTLSSFSNMPAPVSSTTRIAVKVDGGTLFQDGRCAVSLAGSLVFPAGTAAQSVRLRVDPGSSVVVMFESDDLVSSTQVLTVLPADAGAVDAGAVDAGAVDAGAVDAGTVDAGTVDAGTVDAGAMNDGGQADAGTDAGAGDSGVEVDAGSVEVDAGTPMDAGPDAGRLDAGTVDAGASGDAGVAPGEHDYVVGCGCSSEGGALAVFVLLLFVTKRRA